MSDNEDKQLTFEATLAKGTVFVQFWTYWPGVKVPESLMGSEVEILKFSKRFLHPPVVSDKGVSGILSFKGKNRHVTVPWEAVTAIQSGDRRKTWANVEPKMAPMAFA